MAAVDPQKDLVLPPGRYVFILNDKGVIETWVGPSRVTSSGSNDTAVVWNQGTRRFDAFASDPVSAIRPLIQVSKGEYVILEGLPIQKEGEKAIDHPPLATNTRGPDIDVSKSTVLHGPRVFALWPRQAATVIPGHRLALDQYLVVVVRDDEQAKATPDRALIREGGAKVEELIMGARFIIKGTDVSFYMPGPGLEVVKDEDGSYVRNAVTVEQLEYAYLRDQDGKKEYVRGPAVVYPRPTQTFVTRTLDDGSVVKRFRALELTETSAIYVKVTQAYTEEDGPDKGKKREVGEELFLIGKHYPLYWPRVEHMLIKQAGSEIHYSMAIPNEGSGYYVRNKRQWTDEEGVVHKDGVVELIRGPRTLLIDPRNQTLVKRALPLHLVQLMYPGNSEAYAINEKRLQENAQKAGITNEAVYALEASAAFAYSAETKTKGGMVRSAARGFEGDVSTRPAQYAKPHSIDLGSSKYDGAPRMAIEPGSVVMLTNSIGRRRVVRGGEVALLEYDEFPAVLSLSTGTPKSGASRKNDVYLRTVTKISDEVKLETNDGVKLTLGVSYRVRFEGDATKWFDIKDPVGFMTDNLRSRVHHEVSKLGIREFYGDFTGKIRKIVLGEPTAEGKRPGLTFEENGLHVYEVDVLRLSFDDRTLEVLFSDAAKDAFKNELVVAKDKRSLELARELTEVSIAKARLSAESAIELAAHNTRKAEADAMSAIADILGKLRADDERAKADFARLEAAGRLETIKLANEKLRSDQLHAITVAEHNEEIRLTEAETRATVERMASIQPGLINALTLLGETELVGKMAEHFSMQSILGGASVVDVAKRVFEGTRFAGLLEQTKTNS